MRRGYRGQGEQGGSERRGWRGLIHDRRILIFTAAVVLFNVSNQATLPLVAQLLSKDKHGRSAARQITADVFVAETVMIVIALLPGKKADKRGRKPVSDRVRALQLLQGSIQSAMGLGGFLSNLGFGALAKGGRSARVFSDSRQLPVAGGLLYQLRMPETRQ